MNFENLRAINQTHQPVVVCIDTSASMNEDAGNGITKIKMVEDLVNQLADIPNGRLGETDKSSIDLCILGFNNSVYTIMDWQPLSNFKGDIKLSAEGCTALSSVILESIKKVREIRKLYDQRSVDCRRAMIFVYTDGFSTEDMQAAYQKSQSYFNRDYPSPSAKLNMIFIPTYYNGQIIKMTDGEKNWSEYKELVNGLGKKVLYINAEDCVNGVPAAFEFMTDSIVGWSVSDPGETVYTNINDNLTAVKNCGGVRQNSDGSKTAVDEPELI